MDIDRRPGGRSGHLPALDGLRAFAVGAVLLFHGGVSWARGGYLGVDLFFVLSGFLIANKLLGEQERDGRISLREFWIGRVRRLLPAALTVLTAITVYTAFIAEPVTRRSIRGDVWAALLYVANWRFIFSDTGYFESTAAPSPVRHLWSLSVEEQFYILFPLILIGLAALGRRGRDTIGAFIALIAVSTFWTAVLRTNGADITRMYEGTDTRLATILIGVAAAAWLRYRPETPTWIGPALPVAAAITIGITAAADGTQTWLYPWGQLGFAVAAAVVIASGARRPDAASTRLLSHPALVFLGQLSYSLYLWHWPAYLVLTPARTGLDGPLLLLVRVLVSGVLAYLSFRFVEQPIRFRRLAIARPAPLTIATIVAVGGLAALAAADAPDGDLEFAARRLERTTISSGALTAPAPLEVPADGHRPPAAPTDRPLRVTLLGDSAAASLDHFKPDFTDIDYRASTTIGCGLMAPAHPLGQALKDDCAAWADRWTSTLADDPDRDVVLVIVGAWEINPHQLPDGTIYRPEADGTSAATTDYLDGQLDRAVEVIRDHTDARIAFLELACADIPALGIGDATPPRGVPQIVDWFNDRLHDLADRYPGLVQIISLEDRLCPDGRGVTTHDGIVLRDDGTHWTEESAPIGWSWILPMLQQVAHRPII